MRDKEKQKIKELIEELYELYGPSILKMLQSKYKLQKPDAEDLLQETFAIALSKISTVRDENAYRGWLFRIAENLTKNYLDRYAKKIITNVGQKSESSTSINDNKPDDGSPFDNLDAYIEKADESAKKLERKLCMQLCVERAIVKYEWQVLCPLFVTLFDAQCHIDDKGAIIHLSTNEIQHDSEQYREKIDFIGVITHLSTSEIQQRLEQCREEMKSYKDYNEYEKAHGAESLCWLILRLRAIGWKSEEIGKVLGITGDAVRTRARRCRQRVVDIFEMCEVECK